MPATGESIVKVGLVQMRCAASPGRNLMVVACDLRLVEQTRRNRPFLRDRRIDFDEDLGRRFLGSPARRR